jgi:hypothetical protein
MISILKSFVCFTLIFTVLAGYGQKKDSVIERIRRLYKQINTDSSLKTVKLENEQFLQQLPDGGASLKGFFCGDSIRKIHLYTRLSFGVRQYDYYFNDNGKVFFMYETEEDFPYNSKTGSLNYTKLTPAFEGRYYFDDNGRLIETKNKGQKRFDTHAGYTKDIISGINVYAKLLISHLKKEK